MAPFVVLGVIYAVSEVVARTAQTLGRNRRLKGMGPITIVNTTLAISEADMCFLTTTPAGDVVAGMINRGRYLEGQ